VTNVEEAPLKLKVQTATSQSTNDFSKVIIDVFKLPLLYFRFSVKMLGNIFRFWTPKEICLSTTRNLADKEHCCFSNIKTFQTNKTIDNHYSYKLNDMSVFFQ